MKSAADMLRAEASRIGGIAKSKPIIGDLKWAYTVAAGWLDCWDDQAKIRKWAEVKTVKTKKP